MLFILLIVWRPLSTRRLSCSISLFCSIDDITPSFTKWRERNMVRLFRLCLSPPQIMTTDNTDRYCTSTISTYSRSFGAQTLFRGVSLWLHVAVFFCAMFDIILLLPLRIMSISLFFCAACSIVVCVIIRERFFHHFTVIPLWSSDGFRCTCDGQNSCTYSLMDSHCNDVIQ